LLIGAVGFQSDVSDFTGTVVGVCVSGLGYQISALTQGLEASLVHFGMTQFRARWDP